MNVETFAGISVARRVAMRNLDASEIERIKEEDPKLFELASRVMSRVGFVDEIRYHIPLDLSDTLECQERNSLETYLLCTCLDTLAGKEGYVDLQKWLKTNEPSIRGISERNKLMTSQEGEQQVLSKNLFSSLLSNMIDLYNESYGVSKNIKNLINELPVEIKDELAKEYTIYKESDLDGKEHWWQRKTDEKLKIIFVDYLFHYRRNLYTHESKRFRSLGGVSVMREALRTGKTELPPANTIRFPQKNNAYIVTCHYGDEAELLREIIIASLAHKFNVLGNGWRIAYQKAEKRKRLLHALFYELKHNIQIMQLHLQVLSNVIKIDNDSLRLETRVAQSILENNNDQVTTRDVYLLHPHLHPYIEASLQFNNEIDGFGAGAKHHMEDTSQSANDLIVKSKIRLYAKELGNRCEQLLEDYPVWTYATDYYPQN